MKYDAQVAQIQPVISGAQNILIVIPTEVTVDRLAAGLAFYLSLKQAGKNVSIISDGVLTVGFTHLFSIGDVKNQLPQTSAGNYTITLGGVVAPDGKVPALQNLDWSPTGPTKADLKLVFHVMPGQKFEPTFATPAYEGGNFDLIIAVGVSSWAAIGSIYANNPQIFSNTQVLNIDNQANNAQFGSINLVDGSCSSLSQIIGSILQTLSLPYEGDIASNIIAGLFSATNSLQTGDVETFEVMANALRVGGQKPSSIPNTAPMGEPVVAQPAPEQPVISSSTPVWAQAPVELTPTPQGLDISPFLNPQNFSVTPTPENQPEPQQSAEEVPVGEQAQTVNPEADWLTPKIFKSSKIG